MITISHEAKKIHQRTFVIDLHADTLLLVFKFGYNLQKRHRNPLPLSSFVGHVDLPRIKEGGVTAIGFSLPILSFRVFRRQDSALKSLEKINRWALKLQHRFALARGSDDIIDARERGVPAYFLTLEGVHGVADDLESLERYRELGLMSITLAHLTSSYAAYASLRSRRSDHPLPKRGFALIEKMESAGLIVDLAHAGRRSFIDAVGACRKPPIVSHTGCYGIKPMWRNVSDYEAKKIAEKNGVIGVTFYPGFLSHSIVGSVDCVVKHIQYLRKLVGDDFIALGSDFDGWVPSMPKDMRDISRLPLLTETLLKEGLPVDSIKKILGGNALRVIREVCG